MRKFVLFLTFISITATVWGQNRYWVAGVGANWSSDNWANSSGGAPDGGGPPADAGVARFDANGLGDCTLDLASDSTSGLRMIGYTGVLDLNGNTLISSGTVTLTSGTINDTPATGRLRITSINNTTFNGTTIGAQATVSSANILLSGSTFNAAVDFIKTGSGSTNGNGGNVFNAAITLTHQGSGGNWVFANANPDDFNADVTIQNLGNGAIFMCQTAGGSTFDGNIILTANATANGVYFGNNSGTSTMADGFTISIGGGGYTDANLRLSNFTQVGLTPQSLTLGGTATNLDIRSSNFGGNVTFQSPRLFTRSTSYTGTVSLTKTGGNNDQSNGGNIFEGITVLTTTGTGQFLMANAVADTFRTDLTMNHMGSNVMYISNNASGCYIGGNLTINNNGIGTNASVVLANGTSSELTVNGNVVVNNLPSATSGYITLGNSGMLTINGDLIAINNGTGTSHEFNIAYSTLSSVTVGGVSRFTNLGATTTSRYFIGRSGDITFQDSVYVTNNSSAGNSQIYLNRDANSFNTYNGDIVVENIHASADGVFFGSSGGSSTLAAGQSIGIGSNGFLGTGQLYLRNFTQLGAAPISFTTAGTVYTIIYDCNFGGNVSITSPRLQTRGTSYAGTTYFEKIGASDDQSVGGNTFAGDCQLLASGTGYLLMGNGSPDVWSANLTLLNTSSRHIYIAYNSAGNSIGGNFVVNNAGTGTSYILVSSNVNSTLSIVGDVDFTNNGSGSDSRILFGENGDITCQGKVSLLNSGTANTNQVQFANNDSSIVNIADSMIVVNTAGGSNSRIYLGHNGDMNFGNAVSLSSSSGSANSHFYLNNRTNSANTYAGNIVVENTNASGDGVYFGNEGGSGVLAATRTVTIGTGGFIGGYLSFRNFTQVGATAQSLHPTNTTILNLVTSNWGGDVDFSSPRILTRETIYNGTLSLEKTGATNDESYGGNKVSGIATLINSGSGYVNMGRHLPDTFQTHVDMSNTGTNSMYLAGGAFGTFVGGNLTGNHSTSGGGTNFILAHNSSSSLTIGGNLIGNNTSSSSDSRFYVGNNGDLTVLGTSTLVNNGTGAVSLFYIANSSTSAADFGGDVSLVNSGAGSNHQSYIGNDGDVTFNTNLSLENSSSANESRIYLNDRGSSSNIYKGNIVVEVTNASCDGILWGSRSGIGTLAATRTVSIGAGGFIAGQLYFRNFTQVGPTAQTLEPTGTTATIIYDSNWGGDILFSSPRISTRGTVYQGTLDLEKTGGSDDQSVGGNTIAGNCTLTCSGSGYLLMANTSPDTFSLNLHLDNIGTRRLYIAYNSMDNYVGGNLTGINATASGGSFISVVGTASASLRVDGTVNLTNNSSSSDSYLYLGANGTLTINSNVVLTNNSTSVNIGQAVIGDNANSTVSINGNVTAVNSGPSGDNRLFIGIGGDVSITGDVILTNSAVGTEGVVGIANNTSSTVTIGGALTVTNSGVGSGQIRSYIGNNGDVTVDGTMTISNSSPSTTSEVYCHHTTNSVNAYNGDIVLETTHASSDGILFGASGGSGTMAATRTITIGAGGFIAGRLYLRNFTQVGPTNQTLQPTGTTEMPIYDCNWGGNIVFSSPRISTRGTVYSGTLSFEKTGPSNDDSNGGNSIAGNCILTNSGSGRLLLGNNLPDTFGGNVTVTNSGTSLFYLAHNSAGNTIAGNLTVNQTSSGSSSSFIVAQNTAATLVVGGAATITNTGSATSSGLVIADRGTINFGSSLAITHSPSGTNGNLVLANNATSLVTIAGSLSVVHGGVGGNDKRSYIGNAGDVTIGGNFSLTNSCTANSTLVYVADDNSSIITIGGNSTVVQSGTVSTTRTYLGNSGNMTFSGTLTLTNNSGSTNSEIFCNHNPSSIGLYQNNIVLEASNASGDGIRFGQSGGVGTLAATRTITIGGAGFISGQLLLRNFTQVGNTAQTLQPTGTTFMTHRDGNWGGDGVFSSPLILIYGNTFSRTTYFEKTGPSDNASSGGNTFVGNCELVNSGSGYFLMGNTSPDDFQGNLVLNNTGSRHLYIAHNSAGNTIAGTLTATNAGSAGNSYIYLCGAANGSLTVTGDVTIDNTSSSTNGHVYIGDRGDVTMMGNLSYTGSSSATNSECFVASESSSTVIVNGDASFINGGTGTNTHRIYIPRNGAVTLGGKLNTVNSTSAVTGQILLANSSTSSLIIADSAIIVNSGTSTNNTRTYVGNAGDATFNGPLLITNSSGSPNSQVYCNHGGTSSNLYNQDIIIEATNPSGDGVYFGNGGGVGELVASRTITIGANGFISGQLYLRNFTQTGATAQSLHPTGTTLFVLYTSNWGGNVDFSAPRINTRSTVYQGTSQFEKTGGLADDASYGDNTFAGNCTLINSGSRYLLMGNNASDDWQGDLTMQNTGTHNLYIANAQPGNTIAGNLLVNNSGNGNNNQVFITNGNNSNLTIGGTATLNNLTTGTNSRVYFGNNGDITLTGALVVNNNPAVTSGADIYIASGGNSSVILNSTATITNSGTGTTVRTFFGNSGDVTISGDLTITNSSPANNSLVYLNHNNSSSNVYNGNIVLETTNASCDGVYIGQNSGTGTLSAGNAMSIGPNGFIAGQLYIRNFTQLGATAQNMVVTGTTITTLLTNNFEGDVSISSPRLTSRLTTYDGTTVLTKTGAVNDASAGGNIFNGDVSFVAAGTGYFMQGNGTADDYNGDVTYVRTGTGLLYPTYNSTSTYSGDIYFDLNSSIELAGNNGRVLMDGTGPQSINGIGATAEPLFRRLTLANSGDEVTLNTPITIRTNMTFTSGNLLTTATNLLTIRDNATVSGASDDSFVNGPVEKIGNDAFTFPLGDSAQYHPLGISAPSGNTSRFRATYFEADPAGAYDPTSKDGTIARISQVEHWILDRNSGTSNVAVTLTWDTNSAVTELTSLLVVRWDSGLGRWVDHGNGGTTGDTASGTIRTAGTVSTFSPFSLASSDATENPLPIELISFNAKENEDQVDLSWVTATEINNDFFTIERSATGRDFEAIAFVDGAGNSNKVLSYSLTDEQPLDGVSYYRLKQTDFNGEYAYSDIVAVEFDVQESRVWTVYPNPGNGAALFLKIDEGTPESQVLVRDVAGRVWHQQTLDLSGGLSPQLDLVNTLPAGIYFVTLVTGEEQETKRLIVQ